MTDFDFGIDRPVGDINLAVGKRRDEHFAGRVGYFRLGSAGQES